MESIEGVDIKIAQNVTDRRNLLEKWLTYDCQFDSFLLEPLLADASFRRYFRVKVKDRTYVVMDAPPQFEKCDTFISVSAILRERGLKAPEVIHANLELGFLLLTDFGDSTYLTMLNQQNADNLYKKALKSLSILQTIKTDGKKLTNFDETFILNEWSWHKEWFLDKLLGLLPIENESELDGCFLQIAKVISSQPKVFMHRDYHSANLMLLANDDVGILDFQDALIGPITYDLVSLLRDCYIEWPEQQIERWVNDYWMLLRQSHFLENITSDQFLDWFNWMGIERHIKALFTFARKEVRDGQSQYLKNVPRTLKYLLRVTNRYPELKAMHDFYYYVVQPTFLKKFKLCAE